MGFIAGVLQGVGQQAREQHLLDLQDKKDQQDRSLKFLEGAMQNPGVDPQSQQDLLNLYMQASTTPLNKWDSSKVSKGMADIMSQYHDRAVGQAQSNSQQTPAQVNFPIPGGNYNAGGFEANPPLAPAPPPGQQALPTGGLPQPPTLQAGSPNPNAPGMLQQTSMPGLPMPGPSVPGAVQPFIDPMRAAALQSRTLEALAPGKAAEFAAQYGAQQDAEMKRMEATTAFNKQAEKQAVADRIEQLKGDIDPATGKSVWDSLDAVQRANVQIDAKRILEQRTSLAGEFAPVMIEVAGKPTAAFFDKNGGTYVDIAHKPIDATLITSVKPITPTDKNVPVDQQAFKGYLDKAGGDPVKAFQLMEADKEKLKPAAENRGTWQLEEDKDGKPILFNSKTAQTKPVSSIQKSGTKAKQDAATEKLVGPARDAMAYADNYLSNGNFTGSGDEALLEKFFELAKPSSGFRMSQPQIDLLQNSRGIMQSAVGKLRHLTTGTWFSDQQRREIVKTMKDLGAAKAALATVNGGAPQSSVPPNPPAGSSNVVHWGRDAQGNPIPIQ